MRCHEIMKAAVEQAGPEDTVDGVAQQMREQQLGCMPVCDVEGRVIGILTDRDIALRICAERRNAASTHVEEIMTRPVITCRPDDSVDDLERLMTRHQLSRIVITTPDGFLLGIISLTDIAHHEEPLRAARVLREVTARQFRVQGPMSVRPGSARPRPGSQPAPWEPVPVESQRVSK